MPGRRRSSWRSYTPGTVPRAPATPPGAAASAAHGARAVVRVLGLDPGSRITGYGVVDVVGRAPRFVACGAIRAGAGDFPARLHEIFSGVSAVLDEHRPEEVAIERVFVHVNPDSALKLGQARGAALCAVFGGGRQLAEYSPREVKLAVTGSGAAEKAQVARMVRLLLGLEGRLQADAADALAIALCHAHGRAVRSALGAGRGA